MADLEPWTFCKHCYKAFVGDKCPNCGAEIERGSSRVKIWKVLRLKFLGLRLWFRCGCPKRIEPLSSKKIDGLRAPLHLVDEWADWGQKE